MNSHSIRQLNRKTFFALCLGVLTLLVPARLSATPLANGDFKDGMNGWKQESGKAAIYGDHLTIISTDGQGVVSQEVSVEPNTSYTLAVKFRFEKNFSANGDKWTCAWVEVWQPNTLWNESDSSKQLAGVQIKDKLAAGSGAEDSDWRPVTLTFNSGDATSVIIRLRNHPTSQDQTHWNNVSLQKAT